MWTNNPGAQSEFLHLDVREALYGGAAGGGKTDALVANPMRQLEVEHQRWQRCEITESKMWTIHFRLAMPLLTQTINRTRALYPQVDRGAKFNENLHTWTFRCGGHSQFAEIHDKGSHFKYAGPEYSEIDFDELTEFDEEPYTFLSTRLRTLENTPLHSMLWIRAATNPIGRGLEWVRRRFIEPAPPRTIIRDVVEMPDGTTMNQDRIFIPAGVADNPFIGRDYVANLLNRRKAVRDALYYGDWYAVDGAFFGQDWDRARHIVKNRAPRPHTFRFRSGDYGYANYSSVTWWEVDFDGCMTAYHNLYVKRHTGIMLADRIKEIERHYGDWNDDEGRSMLNGPLDPQAFEKDGHTSPSMAEEMIRRGVYWRRAEKNRFLGANQIRQRLLARIPQPDGTMKPLIRWMERCEAPIRTIPALPADPDNPEDVDTHAADHCYDDAMYACLSRPITPTKEKDQEDMFDELSARRNEILNSRYGRGLAALNGG